LRRNNGCSIRLSRRSEKRGERGLPDITWRSALRWARAQLELAGISRPGMEAEYLARPGIGAPPVALLNAERTPSVCLWRRYVEVIQRRAAREPIAYIRGETEFYSLVFYVNPDVLIPRPETETLVDAVRDRANSMPPGPVLELGAGSGAVSVALAVHIPDRPFVLTDISGAVLQVARINAGRHGVKDRMSFAVGDLYGPVTGSCFAAVVSNPPYVRSADLAGLPPEIRQCEPISALDGGADGLKFLRRIARAAPRHLRRGGVLALETGAGQARRVAEFCRDFVGEDVQILHDLAGHERVVVSRYE